MARFLTAILIAGFVVACVPRYRLEQTQLDGEACAFGLEDAHAENVRLKKHLAEMQDRLTVITADNARIRGQLNAAAAGTEAQAELIDELNGQLAKLEKEYDRLLQDMRAHDRPGS